MRKKLLAFFIIFLSVIALGLFWTRKINPPSVVEETVPKEIQSVFVVLNFGDRDFSDFLTIDENSTAFSVLQEFADQNSLLIDIQKYDFGVFVKSIDGFESGPDMAWIYFVNGESGSVASDQYRLESGDTVEWKYIKPDM